MASIPELITAIGTDRHNVGVYLAALAKGPLNAHQAASLETDLKTLDANLAALAAALAVPTFVPPTPAPAEDFSVQPADPPEVVFDPSTWSPLAVAPGTVRMGKYGELFGSAIPPVNAYKDVQTSGGYDARADIPAMFYIFCRGKIVYAQEGNLVPAEAIRLVTQYRPANTTGLTF
jgi:hypothetical protein